MTTINFLAGGEDKTAVVQDIPAFEAYEIKRHIRDFVKSEDKNFRSAFALRVLSFVSVDGVALNSEDAINKKLVSWKNVELLIDAVLVANDLGTIAEADLAVYDWGVAGHKIAEAFMTKAALLMGPGLDLLAEKFPAEKAGE